MGYPAAEKPPASPAYYEGHGGGGVFDVTISQPGIDPVKFGHVAGTMSHR